MESDSIQSVIIRVITKSEDREPEVLFVCHDYAGLQTDIGLHEVHLPINNKYYNFREAQELKNTFRK